MPGPTRSENAHVKADMKESHPRDPKFSELRFPTTSHSSGDHRLKIKIDKIGQLKK
jgi:hypothetical protein